MVVVRWLYPEDAARLLVAVMDVVTMRKALL
jgi:hypothetical protein